MEMKTFAAIIDKIAPHTNTLLFYFMGEPFLNPWAYDMVQYAKKQAIPFITACTNGEAIDARRLIECGIDEVSFQIGGCTQETHARYRIGSDLEQVLGNLRKAVTERNAAKSRARIICGFIVMRHNEHEIPRFREMMRHIGVDDARIIAPCVRTIEQAYDMLPSDRHYWLYNPAAYEQGVLTPKAIPANDCAWIYYSITILVNGDVVPCCRDAHGELVLGNILQHPLSEIWNGVRMRTFRTAILQHQQKQQICRLCSSYGPPRLH